ncbi:iron-containing alcohol dehydrogenase [Rossellomorea sp. NPDC077527]|uniref:iron-containing alcohol dehydrogenase n=1 Tax=Rossellomorea sp. NPDC077527 TaxID=3364510 RepID=UPI0037C7097A
MKELCLPRRLKVGAGSFYKVGEVAKELHASHLFIVCGSLLMREPFLSQFKGMLSRQGLTADFFSGIKGEPTTEELNEALKQLKQSGADCIVAVGGGSVIDLAKALSVMGLVEEATLDSIPGMRVLERLPLIAVPTTAGTGSEASRVTVITERESQVKKNPGHEGMVPDAAILDPVLTVSLPKHVTAYTGLDALAHAMEAYVSRKATPLSDHFALEAVRLIGKWLPEAYENGEDLEAREMMLLGSYYAGVAFSNASTNLAHAAARPLGARFHIPHGLSVALLMPYVIEFGLEAAAERYADIGHMLGGNQEQSLKKAEYVLERVREFNDRFNILQEGSAYIPDGEAFINVMPTLIQNAMSGNGILTNKTVPDERDIERIYLQLLTSLKEEWRMSGIQK